MVVAACWHWGNVDDHKKVADAPRAHNDCTPNVMHVVVNFDMTTSRQWHGVYHGIVGGYTALQMPSG